MAENKPLVLEIKSVCDEKAERDDQLDVRGYGKMERSKG